MRIAQKDCTGCGACSAVCPIGCIEMQPIKNGFLKPTVDTSRCRKCNLCITTCPQNKMPKASFPQKCYAAWSKNDSDYRYSASGGVGAAIARKQLSDGGAFFGCDYQSNGELKHFSVKCEEDVSRIQSSKYTQSNASHCFADIKDLLKKKVSVVFVGTPCQCAALLNYIGKPNPNLITVDLVCHGAPPNSYLIQHIEELGIAFPIRRIRFRGEFDQQLTIWKEDTIVYQKSNKEDTYFRAFYQNMISYNACLNCQYAQAERISDITMGDFWGLKELRTIDRMSERPSVILINTLKGAAYFAGLKKYLIIEERDPREAIEGNGRLMNPPGQNMRAWLFRMLHSISNLGFDNAVNITERSYCFALGVATIVKSPYILLKKVIFKLKSVLKYILKNGE